MPHLFPILSNRFPWPASKYFPASIPSFAFRSNPVRASPPNPTPWWRWTARSRSRANPRGFFKSLARKFLNDENFFQQSFVADDEPGSVLLAPNLPGDVVVLDVGERQYMLSDGAFLAATDGVELETKTQSLGRALLGNSGGLFLMATQGHGQIALSGFGSIQAVDVKPGQKLIVDNGHLVTWDRELDYELSINTARSGLLGKVLHSQLSGEGIVLKFKGEGKVWVCSRNKGGFLTWIFSQMPQEKAVSNG